MAPHILPTETLNTCTSGSFSCLATWAFTVTQGMFWVFALLAFCIAIFIATSSRFGTNKSLAFAGFVALSGSMYMAILGLMSWWLASAFMLAGVATLAIVINSDK